MALKAGCAYTRDVISARKKPLHLALAATLYLEVFILHIFRVLTVLEFWLICFKKQIF